MSMDSDETASKKSELKTEGVAKAPSPEPSTASAGSVGSVGSVGTTGTNDKTIKRRTWKKPKDKPKRPLSAYNIFFQHKRARIVEGHTEDATPEEIVRSIEHILTKSRVKRRHRKSHGRISFGDLARTIADMWKVVDPKSKAIFDHYAEVDMYRYRREVKAWKEKKEREGEALLHSQNPFSEFGGSLSNITSMGPSSGGNESFRRSMNSSFSSVDTADTDYTFDDLPFEGSGAAAAATATATATAPSGGGGGTSPLADGWVPRRSTSMHDSFNSSFSSIDSHGSDYAIEPLPFHNMIVQQKQLQQQHLQEQQQLLHHQRLQQHRLQQQQQQHFQQHHHFDRFMGTGAGLNDPYADNFGNSSMSSLQLGDVAAPPSASAYLSHPYDSVPSLAASGLGSSHTSDTTFHGSHSYATSYSHYSHSTITDGMPPQRAAFFDPIPFSPPYAASAHGPSSAARLSHMGEATASRDLERYLGDLDLDARGGNDDPMGRGGHGATR